MAAPLASKAGSAGTNSKPPFPELDFRSGARVEELNKLIQEFTKHDQREYDDQRALEIHTAKDFIFSMLGRAGSVRGGGSGDAGRGPRGRAPGRCGTGRPFPRAAGTPGSGVPGRRAGLTPRKLFFACPVRPVFSSDGFRSTEQRLGRRAGRCPRNTPNRQGWRRGEPDPSLCFPPAIKAVGNTDYYPPPRLLDRLFWLLDRLMLVQEHPLNCVSCLGCKTCYEWNESDCGRGVLICVKL